MEGKDEFSMKTEKLNETLCYGGKVVEGFRWWEQKKRKICCQWNF
jgi:hypothetical protein